MRQQSRDTQRSISVAERALTELERPFVYAEVTDPGLSPKISGWREGHELQRGVFELSFFNFGRTPAILTRLEYELIPADRGGIADPIDPLVIGRRELPAGLVAAPDHPYSERTNMRRAFASEEIEVVEGKQSVWLVGFIRYRDIFGTHYITGFTKVGFV